MKKNIIIVAAAVAVALGSVSCNKNATEPQQAKPESTETSYLTISLSDGNRALTKAATVDTVSSGKESVLKDVQLFVFDDNEVFEKYVHVSNWDSLVNASGNPKISVKTGFKILCAVCNGPDLSAQKTITGITGTVMELSAYNDPDSSFVMYGECEGDVSSTQDASFNVKVMRFVSKIYIAQVKNNLPPQFGDITMKYAFLENLPAKITLGNIVQYDSDWYNKYGRASEATLVSGHIIDGKTYLADAPKLTFKSYSDTTITRGDSLTARKTFYCLPNNYYNSIDTFSPTFQNCGTKAVIAATIGGTLYYYSINIGKINRNTVYGIYLTISGLGSTDPAASVSKGSINTSISVSPWSKTTAIEEDI